MLIAKEKMTSNVAEYILYMWQIEDIIRSLDFSPEKIKIEIVDKFEQPPKVKKEMMQWYIELMRMMREEGLTQKGHLLFLIQKVNELNDFHMLLLLSHKQNKYHDLYVRAKLGIEILAFKGSAEGKNEIDICLTGLYGLLILKLQKKPISEGTAESLLTISALIAQLAEFYKKYENGEIDLEEI